MTRYRIGQTVVVAVLAAFVNPNVVRADRWAAASLGWCFASCSADCPGTGDGDVDPDFLCAVTCEVGNPPPTGSDRCHAESWAWATPPWIVKGDGSCDGAGSTYGARLGEPDGSKKASGRATGLADSEGVRLGGNPRGGPGPSSAGEFLEATGRRESEPVFRITGVSARAGGATQELSLVRYTGDPSDYQAVTAASTDDLIAAGLITGDDILLRVVNEEIPSVFDYVIDVTGIPDEQIVINTFGHGAGFGMPPVTGACCTYQASGCLMTTPSDCDTLGGGYRGDSITCQDIAECSAIPTVSEWGLIVMSLLVLTGGTLVYTRGGGRFTHSRFQGEEDGRQVDGH